MNSSKVFRVSLADDAMIVELLGVVSSLADDSITRELDTVRQRLRTSACSGIVIDFGQVAYFGSSMLEAIRALWNDLTPNEGRLILCNASEVGREILQVAKFDHIWPLVDTREQALQLLKA
ncbi:MAG: Sulfate transporter/antisigma-factor antagonist [Schlesneria sp.]|jgi:anti-anti-sigma factor|nr:Sulfate transporter/antisigma-factor antagonist [Schlesneria sp.]